MMTPEQRQIVRTIKKSLAPSDERQAMRTFVSVFPTAVMTGFFALEHGEYTCVVLAVVELSKPSSRYSMTTQWSSVSAQALVRRMRRDGFNPGAVAEVKTMCERHGRRRSKRAA